MLYFYTIDVALKLCTLTGIHPEKGFSKSEVFRYILFMSSTVFMLVLLSLQFVYMDEPPTVMIIADFISCFFLLFHGMVKCTTMFLNREKILDLLKRTHQDFWDFKVVETTSPTKRECLQPLENLKKMFHIYIAIYMTSLFTFALFPILSKGEELLVYECYRPPWLPYYVLLLLEQIVGTTCTLFTMLPVDFLFMSLTTLTLVQYKMLNMELRQLLDTETKTDDTVLLMRKIGECVKHHAYLHDYVKRINNTFSSSLFIFHLIVILSMCMEMYRASTQSDWSVCVRPMLYTSFGLFQFIICYCAHSQALIDEASNVSVNIYLSEWQQASMRSKKSVIMIIAMAQRDIKITAGGIANIDLKTGLDTLKTMVSYCMFLRTISHGST